MRVEDPMTDNIEQPEECECCGSDVKELERFVSFGPGHQVEWLCCYCSRSLAKHDLLSRSFAQMLHHLEDRIRGAMAAQLDELNGVKV